MKLSGMAFWCRGKPRPDRCSGVAVVSPGDVVLNPTSATLQTFLLKSYLLLLLSLIFFFLSHICFLTFILTLNIERKDVKGFFIDKGENHNVFFLMLVDEREFMYIIVSFFCFLLFTYLINKCV